jgi:cardiolipin synthase
MPSWLSAVPSALSLSRIAFTPPIAIAIVNRESSYAFLLCVIAGATDFFDGYLARRFHWTSRTGAWLDAVSDKVLLSTIYVCFGVTLQIPWWLMYLVLGRDLMILLLAGFGLAFTSIRDFPPSVWGKISTNVQIATAAAILAGPPWLAGAMIALCAAATAGSGFHYLAAGIGRWRHQSASGLQ